MQGQACFSPTGHHRGEDREVQCSEDAAGLQVWRAEEQRGLCV